MMSPQRINARELVAQIVKERNWYKGIMTRQLAYMTKKAALQGGLSYEKCSEILEALGYQKVDEEAWDGPKASE